MLLSMELVKVDLVFDTIMGTQKHIDMWLDPWLFLLRLERTRGLTASVA